VQKKLHTDFEKVFCVVGTTERRVTFENDPDHNLKPDYRISKSL